MKQKINQIPKKERGIEYLSLALYAFLGLGCEVPLAFWLEPMIYGHQLKDFTLMQTLLHWGMTCAIWITFSFLILRYAKKELDFKIADTNAKVKPIAWIVCILLIACVTYMNFLDVGTIKPYHEFLILGTVKFVFQHLYYLVETMLFTQIIVFGQIALEKWTKKKNFPFGAIIVGCSWGLAHIFNKGIVIGLECMILGFLFGVIYLILQRDVRKTYLVLALAFIL